MTFTIDPSLLWGLFFGVLNAAFTVGMMVWNRATRDANVSSSITAVNARIDTIKETVDGHAEKTERISPIETDIEGLKRQMSVEFKNVRDDIRDLARSIQSLAFALARQPHGAPA